MRVEVPDSPIVDHLFSSLDRFATSPGDHLPLGYRVTTSNGLTVLIDRSATVLARSRSEDDVLHSLFAHLWSLSSSQPDPRTRVRGRAVMTPSGIVLIPEPRDHTQGFVERSLQRQGQAIVDAPFIDIDLETSTVRSLPTPESVAAERAVPGHRAPWDLDEPLAGALIPNWLAPSMSRGQLIFAFVQSIWGVEFEEAIDRAERIVSSLERTIGLRADDRLHDRLGSFE